MKDWFGRAARVTAEAMGSPITFVSAVALVLLWAVSGPFFHYSENWQLVINTLTTVATFLAVFLLQNTQNTDSKAVQLKLDELIRSSNARNDLIGLEQKPADAIVREESRDVIPE